jgi:hypothetical protein
MMAMLPAVLQSIAIGAAMWLVVLSLWPRRRQARQRCATVTVLAGLVALLALLLPLGGPPLWLRAWSFYSNPSLPMLGLVGAALSRRVLGLTLLRGADWLGVWLFGVVAGSTLYLHPLLGTDLDLYFWGWDRTGAAFALATVAVSLLAFGHRLGVLLLVALIAFAITTLESRNCWDYVVDPFYWLLSLGMLTARGITFAHRRYTRSTVGTQVVEILPPLPEFAAAATPAIAQAPSAGQTTQA